MQKFSLDRNRCTRCGECMTECNRQILVADEAGYPSLPAEKFSRCNACGHCSAVCPTGAAIFSRYGGEPATPYPAAPALDFSGAWKFLLSCRSVRRYTPESVKEETILEILDVARKAPSASNLQPVRWAILDSRKKAENFTALTMEWFDTVMRYDAEFLSRYNVDQILERYRSGYDTILRGAPNAAFAATDKASLWGAIDGVIAMTYFCLAAHGKGLGSCWSGFGLRAVAAYQPLRDLMGFDDATAVHGMAFFGHPVVKYHAIPPRKPLRVSWCR